VQEAVKQVRVDHAVAEYILRLVDATRNDPRVHLPVSPRGSLAMYRGAQALAYIEECDFVLPEDIRRLAEPVLAHRISLDTKARYGGVLPRHLLEEALEKIPVPR